MSAISTTNDLSMPLQQSKRKTFPDGSTMVFERIDHIDVKRGDYVLIFDPYMFPAFAKQIGGTVLQEKMAKMHAELVETVAQGWRFGRATITFQCEIAETNELTQARDRAVEAVAEMNNLGKTIESVYTTARTLIPLSPSIVPGLENALKSAADSAMAACDLTHAVASQMEDIATMTHEAHNHAAVSSFFAHGSYVTQQRVELLFVKVNARARYFEISSTLFDDNDRGGSSGRGRHIKMQRAFGSGDDVLPTSGIIVVASVGSDNDEKHDIVYKYVSDIRHNAMLFQAVTDDVVVSVHENGYIHGALQSSEAISPIEGAGGTTTN